MGEIVIWTVSEDGKTYMDPKWAERLIWLIYIVGIIVISAFSYYTTPPMK